MQVFRRKKSEHPQIHRGVSGPVPLGSSVSLALPQPPASNPAIYEKFASKSPIADKFAATTFSVDVNLYQADTKPPPPIPFNSSKQARQVNGNPQGQSRNMSAQATYEKPLPTPAGLGNNSVPIPIDMSPGPVENNKPTPTKPRRAPPPIATSTRHDVTRDTRAPSAAFTSPPPPSPQFQSPPPHPLPQPPPQQTTRQVRRASTQLPTPSQRQAQSRELPQPLQMGVVPSARVQPPQSTPTAPRSPPSPSPRRVSFQALPEPEPEPAPIPPHPLHRTPSNSMLPKKRASTIGPPPSVPTPPIPNGTDINGHGRGMGRSKTSIQATASPPPAIMNGKMRASIYRSPSPSGARRSSERLVDETTPQNVPVSPIPSRHGSSSNRTSMMMPPGAAKPRPRLEDETIPYNYLPKRTSSIAVGGIYPAGAPGVPATMNGMMMNVPIQGHVNGMNGFVRPPSLAMNVQPANPYMGNIPSPVPVVMMENQSWGMKTPNANGHVNGFNLPRATTPTQAIPMTPPAARRSIDLVPPVTQIRDHSPGRRSVDTPIKSSFPSNGSPSSTTHSGKKSTSSRASSAAVAKASVDGNSSASSVTRSSNSKRRALPKPPGPAGIPSGSSPALQDETASLKPPSSIASSNRLSSKKASSIENGVPPSPVRSDKGERRTVAADDASVGSREPRKDKIESKQSRQVERLQDEASSPIPKKTTYSPMPSRRKTEHTIEKRARLHSTPLRPSTPKAEQGDGVKEDNEPEPEPEPPYPFVEHLSIQPLFACLLQYLNFAEYLAIAAVHPGPRLIFDDDPAFREEILERFLGTVGYWRWDKTFNGGNIEIVEPLSLNLKDLNAYMRAVSIPMHRYADFAADILSNQGQGNGSGQSRSLAKSARAYTRIILRLRAQAEAEIEYLNAMAPSSSEAGHSIANGKKSVPSSYSSPRRSMSRPPSRAGSAVSSEQHPFPSRSHSDLTRPHFRSPLYRPHHAPLLRVFVISPEGPWLSDTTILECEKELKRSCSGAKGRLSKQLLRVGDVVWNCAVGDEANLGRSIWDGNYLIDLDYNYSKTGAIPRYLHSLTFPPSYFHNVLRSGTGVDADPIVQIDIAPFGEQIEGHLQLLQERVAMDTPQGGRHSVLRWSHRSKFRIPAVYRSASTLNVQIPGAEGAFVDAAWAGIVIVETEGTNEGLAELQARCGSTFPKFRRGLEGTGVTPAAAQSRLFRLLRERSRPGEIWIRVVREKERLM